MDDTGQEPLSTESDNLPLKRYPAVDDYSSTLISLDTTYHGMAGITAVYPGACSASEYLGKKELLSTPVRKRFFPRASPSILKALLETPPMRIYSSEASDEPCTRLGWAVDSSPRVLETSSLAKRHGLDGTQSSRTSAPASLPSPNANATALPLRLSLLPASSATPGPASSDSFALSLPLPTSDAGSAPDTHTYTQSARAPHSKSTSDPFVASRRSSQSRSHGRPLPAPPVRAPELVCPTAAAPAPHGAFEPSAAPTRPAGCEGPPSPSSAYYVRPDDPHRVMGSGLPVGMLEQFQRVMRELEQQGLGDESDGSDIVGIGVEPPSPSPKPGRGHLPYSDAELKLTPLGVARGSAFSGSVVHYPYSCSQSQLACSDSDADMDVVAELAHGHGHERDSLRLAPTASAPLLCSLGPGLESDDGHIAPHTHTHNVTEAVYTPRTGNSTPGDDGFRFWQPRFSLHAAGGGSSSGSAGASGVCASQSPCLQPSSTFAAMRRDFIALLSDQADEEEAQAGMLRQIADRLEKRARSKRHLIEAMA